jgi:hypothetical protein
MHVDEVDLSLGWAANGLYRFGNLLSLSSVRLVLGWDISGVK